MRLLAMVLVLAGCGRLGFEASPRIDDAPPDTSEPPAGTGRSITVPAQTEVLPGFPLLVKLDATRVDLAAIDPATLRFYQGDATPLPYEIEESNDSMILAWVRVDLGTAPITLAIRWGDASLPTATAPMWNADYEAVWHFGDKGEVAYRDATGAFPAKTDGVATQVGFVGNAAGFSGNGSLQAGIAGATLSTLTASAWIFRRSAQTSWYGAMTRQHPDVPMVDAIFLGGRDEVMVTNFFTDVATGSSHETGALDVGRWHHIALVADPGPDGTLTAYLDGVAKAVGFLDGAVLPNTRPLFLGAGCNSAASCPDVDFLDGALDEARIERVVRGPAWIAAEVASQRDELVDWD